MKTLKLYILESAYVDYLRKYDSKVPYNKGMKRPYVGVVLVHNGYNYFAPLASPKEKHLKISEKAIDVFKIKNGKLGIININNMIPTPQKCLIDLLPTIKDMTYKNLLENQLTFLNNNRVKLYKKINHFYNEYKRGFLDNSILERCCNFSLLEQKCLAYEKRKIKEKSWQNA